MSWTRRELLAIGLAVVGLVGAVAGAAVLVTSAVAGQPVPTGTPSLPAFSAASPGTSAAPTADLVVDVQGAVKHPGVVLLPPGSRIADALDAAGGYSRDADLNAAATALNLAAPLTDGAQVYVPVIGLASGPGGGGTGGGAGVGGGGTGGSGLVNLNTATPEELEALPGIGPVTVQLIVAGRAEQPFATLDEMVERDIIDRGQLEDIRNLVTF
jgi:competence protein ComEA